MFEKQASGIYADELDHWIEKKADGTWWAYGPQGSDNGIGRKIICAYQSTKVDAERYVAQYIEDQAPDERTVDVEKARDEALREYFERHTGGPVRIMGELPKIEYEWGVRKLWQYPDDEPYTAYESRSSESDARAVVEYWEMNRSRRSGRLSEREEALKAVTVIRRPVGEWEEV